MDAEKSLGSVQIQRHEILYTGTYEVHGDRLVVLAGPHRRDVALRDHPAPQDLARAVLARIVLQHPNTPGLPWHLQWY